MEYSFSPILHVEDDENDILLLKRAMCSVGIPRPLQTVRDGEQAISYLQGDPPFEKRQYYPLPCLILLDLSLPLMNGLEVLRWRQSQPKIKRIPVIILTSSEMPVDVIAAYEAGANGYLVKPIEFDCLVDMMAALQTFWLANNHFAPLFPSTVQPPLLAPQTAFSGDNNHHSTAVISAR